MKTKYILLGDQAVRCFQNEDWKNLEECVLDDFGGDIVGYDIKKDKFSTLLDMLDGWDRFIQLRKKDLKRIEKNTKIEIEWN